MRDALLQLAEKDTVFLPLAQEAARMVPPREGPSRLDLLELRSLLESAREEPREPASAGKPPSGILNATQAAEMLGVSSKTIYRLARQQKLPCTRIGGAVRFRRTALERFLEARSTTPWPGATARRRAARQPSAPQARATAGPPAADGHDQG